MPNHIEVSGASGSGTRLVNQAPLALLSENLRIAEQNPCSRARVLIGDYEPREHKRAHEHEHEHEHERTVDHELTVQVRALDTAARSDNGLGNPSSRPSRARSCRGR